MWSSTTAALYQHLLVDSNHDGFVDGVAACFVPLTPATATPEIWAAMANFAARLGLEAPAIHLPMVITETEIQSWQCPIFLSWHGNDSLAGSATPVRPQHWVTDPAHAALVDQPALRIEWVMCDQQRGLWLHGVDQAEVAGWLNQFAITTPDAAAKTRGQESIRCPLRQFQDRVRNVDTSTPPMKARAKGIIASPPGANWIDSGSIDATRANVVIRMGCRRHDGGRAS